VLTQSDVCFCSAIEMPEKETVRKESAITNEEKKKNVFKCFIVLLSFL
jgi:hypothetical protein